MEPTMRKAVGRIAVVVALLGGGSAVAASAQEAPQPNIGLTLTETLNRLAPTSSSKDDLREIPAPKNDKLSDSVRITVSVGDGQCLPGEDGLVTPRSARRARVR